MSTVKDADEIVFMHEGKVVERGSHSDLLAKCAGYKKLVQRQLVNEL